MTSLLKHAATKVLRRKSLLKSWWRSLPRLDKFNIQAPLPSEFLSYEEKLKFEDEELKMQKIRDKYSNTIQISQFIPLGVQLKKVMSDEAKAEYSQSETRKEEIIREYISKQIYKCVSAYIEVEKTKIVKIDWEDERMNHKIMKLKTL